MENICEICGFKYPSEAHYCGKCGVDLTDKTELQPPANPKKESKKSKKRNATKDTRSNENVIKWCEIHAVMTWHEMTFPFFLNLVLLFAEGKKDLGFCDCAVCNLGYRELQTTIINLTEKKKLKPSSREIVSKYHDADIAGMKIHFPQLMSETKPKLEENNKVIKSENALKSDNKVTIEIDRDVIEDLIINIFSSEKGQQIIKQIQ